MTTQAISTAKKRVRGPRSMPIIGWRGNYMQYVNDPTGHVWSLYKQYGTLCGFVQFDEAHKGGTIWAFGSEEIQYILTNPILFHNSAVSAAAPPNTALWWLARAGLFTLNGEEHKKERRLLMPAFHKKRIETYYNDIVTLTNQRLAEWKIGESRNMVKEMLRLTQDISVKVLFGIDAPAEEDTIRLLFSEWVRLGMLADLIPIKHPLLPYGRLFSISEQLRDILYKIISEKRAMATQGNDMLSLLIYSQREDGTTLSDDEVISELHAFWNANDTTGASLVWTLFLLIQNPAVMTTLMDDFDHYLHGEPPSLEQLGQLSFLERIIKESMRLLPTGNFLTTRVSMEPFEIGPYHLTKGTKIAMCPYVTHHMPEHYKDANKFQPDRWLTIDPSPYQYIPFGAGPRQCIGSPLANLEMMIVLPMILQRFRLSLEPNIRIDRHERPILQPKNGLPVTVNAQDRHFTKTPVRGNIHEMVEL